MLMLQAQASTSTVDVDEKFCLPKVCGGEEDFALLVLRVKFALEI